MVSCVRVVGLILFSLLFLGAVVRLLDGLLLPVTSTSISLQVVGLFLLLVPCTCSYRLVLYRAILCRVVLTTLYTTSVATVCGSCRRLSLLHRMVAKVFLLVVGVVCIKPQCWWVAKSVLALVQMSLLCLCCFLDAVILGVCGLSLPHPIAEENDCWQRPNANNTRD